MRKSDYECGYETTTVYPGLSEDDARAMEDILARNLVERGLQQRYGVYCAHAPHGAWDVKLVDRTPKEPAPQGLNQPAVSYGH